MDFKGQQRAEKLAMKIMIYASMLAFFVGYFKEDFLLTMGLFLAGVVVTFLVTVPNWPMYNKHPIAWVEGKKGKKEPAVGMIAKLLMLFS